MKLKFFLIALLGIIISSNDYTLSWFFNSDINSNKMKFVSVENHGNLNFESQPNLKGIPGEIIKFSKNNFIHLSSQNESFVFKIVYTATDDSCVSSLILEQDPNIILYKSDESTDLELVYYGVVPLLDLEYMNIGDLFVEFKDLSQKFTHKNYNVDVDFIACRQDISAIEEILGQNAIKYVSSII